MGGGGGGGGPKLFLSCGPDFPLSWSHPLATREGKVFRILLIPCFTAHLQSSVVPSQSQRDRHNEGRECAQISHFRIWLSCIALPSLLVLQASVLWSAATVIILTLWFETFIKLSGWVFWIVIKRMMESRGKHRSITCNFQYQLDSLKWRGQIAAGPCFFLSVKTENYLYLQACKEFELHIWTFESIHGLSNLCANITYNYELWRKL